jgi:ligand-binding sensor domain-containing protein/serine phosphatase RsbU (regulator of sigma subunit)
MIQGVKAGFSVHGFYKMFLAVKIHIRTYVNCKVILLLFFSVLTHHAFSQDYNFRNFSSEEGLLRPYVYSITQDTLGYLWVGTDEGLLRYNGFIFKNYTTNDSLADKFVTCSIRDGKGLWFGHTNGRVSFYDGKKFHQVILTEGRNSGPITHFAKSPDGQIWVSTSSDGLFKLNKKKIVFENNIFKDKQVVHSFDFLSDNELLIGTDSGLKYCRLSETGELEIIRLVVEIPESKVTSIQKRRSGSGFYIATENDGIFNLTYGDSGINVSKIITDPAFDFVGIQNIYEDSQSNIWLGSFGKGLIKMIHTATGEIKITIYNKASGFPADNVKIVYEDREGNIWSGNFGDGLTQITPKPFSIYVFDKALSGNAIFSIFLNQQYRWLGTENGLMKTDPTTGKVIKFYGKGLPKDTVTAIYSSDGKELWIGTDKHGIFRMNMENDKILKYPVGNGSLENSITMITGKGNHVWIGTKKGLCFINSASGRINWYSINQGGLPHNFINSLYLDKKERLWVSTKSSTLAYIQDEKVYKIPLNFGTGIITLGPVVEDTNSRIWVGSNGNGIFRIESDSIINLTTKEGLLSNFCYSLICDVHQNIWVGHKGGLSRIRTADFSVKPIQHIENSSDNLQFNPNAISIDQLEKIWFGSDRGLVCYNPSMELPRSEPPVLGITSIRINDEEKDFADKKIILSPGNYKIRIDFLGSSLKDPTLVTYQSKLEGYDQWSEITKNTSVTYYHLTEGEYTFFLKASSGDGVVTPNPLSLRFIIEKPIWKKLWFYAVTLILLTVLIFFFIKRREKSFLKEKGILEEKVLERTYEIQCQKNEIELQRDEIDKKNTNITSSILYASHIQNAVLPPSELIDKLLPDNFILSKPKDIVSGDFYWLAEKDNKIIFTVADCTGHGVPGAFMSLLGITLLNEIVNIHGITRSDAIVTALRERVIQSLQQNRKDVTTSDGMDIVLCVLDKRSNKLQYTGAKNDLVYIASGKLEIIKADHWDVSISYGDNRQFAMKEIDIKKGDVFYLFSDGYQDQFGGDYDKKFLRPHFYNTLFEIHRLPMMNQKEILAKKLNEWMKNHTQTDDITVMGIRL